MNGDGHWVLLARDDVARCAEVAERRNRDGLHNANGLRASHQAGGQLHLLGCLGEFAFALAIGREWSGDVDTFRSRPDVGKAEVRTRSRADYDLIVRDDDSPAKPYVLVNGAETNGAQAPVWLEVVGWLWGHEARRPCWLRAYGGRPPAYFVPRAGLRPMPS